jgi:predicted AlkP superfamily phosphohydrolase/phosphomutase
MGRRRVVRVALALVVALGCRSLPRATPPRAGTAPAPHQPRHRVILLSIDGAGADDLWRLHREHAFGPDGFERFFTEGEVAERMIPVDPTMTAPNHASMVSGYPPALTGIVSNSFHRPSDPINRRTVGFTAPNEAETLWQAARRQGLKAGVVGWPAVGEIAGSPDAADWAIPFPNDTLRYPMLKEIAPTAWQPRAGPPPSTPGGHAGDVAAKVELEATDVLVAQTLEVVPVATGAPGVYDAVWIDDGNGTQALLHAGEWARLSAPLVGGGPGPTFWVELRSIDRALATAILYVGDTNRTHPYPQRFADALARAGVVWPGEPFDDVLSWDDTAAALHVWVDESERLTRYCIDAILSGAREEDWDLIIGYVPVIDETLHALLFEDPSQPDWTPELAGQMAEARLRVWRIVDRALGRLLGAIDAGTTVIVVSDHGLVPMHAGFYPNAVLEREGLLVRDAQGVPDAKLSKVVSFPSSAVSHLYLNLRGREPGGIVAPADAPALIARLRELFGAVRIQGERPLAAVLTREQASAIGMGHENTGDLVLVGAPGWSLVPGKPAHEPVPPKLQQLSQAGGDLANLLYWGGQHGYLEADNPGMDAIYLALGPGIAPRTVPRFSNLEVAPRVARALGIEPPRPRRPAAPSPP